MFPDDRFHHLPLMRVWFLTLAWVTYLPPMKDPKGWSIQPRWCLLVVQVRLWHGKRVSWDTRRKGRIGSLRRPSVMLRGRHMLKVVQESKAGLLSEWTQMRSPCFQLFLMSVLVLCPPIRLFHYVWIWGCWNPRPTDMRLWDYVRLEKIAFLLLFWGFWKGGSRFWLYGCVSHGNEDGPCMIGRELLHRGCHICPAKLTAAWIGHAEVLFIISLFFTGCFFNLFSRASQMPHSSVQSSPLCDLELFTSYVWARLEIQEIWVTFHDK